MKARPALIFAVAVLLALPLFGFAQKQSAPAPQAQSQQPAQNANANAQNEDDVREAVFRYQFKELNVQVAYYFISIDNKNPTQAFLDRFRENSPEVRPAADAHFEKKPIPGYVERHNDKQGIMFRQGAIRWNSETQADVEGGYECGDLCDPANGAYHVAHTADGWNVTSFDPAKPHS